MIHQQAIVIRNAFLLATATALLLVGFAAFGQVPPGGTLCIRSVQAVVNGQAVQVPLTFGVSQSVRVALGTPGIQGTAGGAVQSVSVTLCSGQVVNLALTTDLLSAVVATLPPTTQVSPPASGPATAPASQPASQPATAPASQPATPPAPPGPRTASAPFAVLNRTGDVSIRNLIVRGNAQGQNIVVQSINGGVTIDNVVSLDAWGDGQFSGQGIYVGAIAGDVTISNSYFGYNGRPRAPPVANGPQTPTPYRHDIYADATIGHLTVTGCILSQAGNAGIQTRTLAGSTVTNCIFLDCATALLLIEGKATVSNCIVWGGQYQYDGSGETSNTAIRAYWPFVVTNSYILTRAGQATAAVMANHPTAKAFPQGAVNVGGVWVHQDPPFTPPAGWPNIAEYVSGSGNVVNSDWPGGVWIGPTKGPGFSTLKGPGPGLNYAPILAKVEAGGSVADAIASIRLALGVR